MPTFQGWATPLGELVQTTGTSGSSSAIGGTFPGVYCHVFTAGTQAYADIYADDGERYPNPFFYSPDADFTFEAPDDRYDLLSSESVTVTPTPTLLYVASYATADLPAVTEARAGLLARVTDGVRGLWMVGPAKWFPLSGGVVTVSAYGAAGDGVTDDSTAFAAAIAAVGARGVVYVPSATYVIHSSLTWGASQTGVLVIIAPGVIVTGTGGLPLPTRFNRIVDLGAMSVQTSTAGGQNSIYGVNAAGVNDTGYSLTAIGYNALVSNTSGDSNTAVGTQSGAHNVSSSYNVYVGSFAGTDETGQAICYVGYKSGFVSTNSNRTTLVGNSAGFEIQTSDDTTVVGYNAGDGLHTGVGCTAVGTGTVFGAAVNRASVFGYGATATIDDAVVLGDPTNSAVRVGVGTSAPTSRMHVTGLPVYANNAAAVGGGLTAGAFYRTGADPDPICVVH